VERFPSLDLLLVLPRHAHPCPVHKDGQLTNLLAIKLRSTHGLSITFSAHWVCRHFSYAHTFAAVITINTLTRETHVTYPLSYCYVITRGTCKKVGEYLSNLLISHTDLDVEQGETEVCPFSISSKLDHSNNVDPHQADIESKIPHKNP
jgi:hypothetical protein